MSKTFPRTARQERDAAALEIVDLKGEDLPHLDTALAGAGRARDHILERLKKIDEHLREAQRLDDQARAGAAVGRA